MELRHLRYFIAVCENSTFVRAAELLRLAQPALTRQVQALERELDTPLLIRGRRSVSLTPAGSICLESARSIVGRVDSAIQRAQLADAGRVGKCTIYVSVWALWSGFSARLISYLQSTEPGIQIRFEEAGSEGHWATVDSGTADIAISTKPPPGFPELVSDQLLHDVVDMALLPMSHRLARRPSLTLNELEGEPFLIYGPSVVNLVDHDLDAAFAAAGFATRERRIVPSIEALITMVTAGMGWSLQRRSLRGKIPGVAMVPVDGFSLSFPVALVWRKYETSAAVFTVLKRIRELASTQYPELYVQHRSVNDKVREASSDDRRPHGLEFRHLRYFLAAVEDSSIGRAAGRLGITQPALSRQIANLERDVGVALLSRSPRGVAPTAAGVSFRRDAQIILDEVAALPADVGRGERAASGKCNIAAVPSNAARDLLSLVVAVASAELPGASFHIQNIPTPFQPGELRKGSFDIGICFSYPGLISQYPDIECRELMPDSIDCALVSERHPLASRKQIDLSDLADIPFLFFQRDFHPGFFDFLMDKFRVHGFEPKLGTTQEGLQTMWALTAAGEGWSLGSSEQRADPPLGVAAIPIRGFSIPWGIVLLTRRSESSSVIIDVARLIQRITGGRKELSLENARPRGAD